MRTQGRRRPLVRVANVGHARIDEVGLPGNPPTSAPRISPTSVHRQGGRRRKKITYDHDDTQGGTSATRGHITKFRLRVQHELAHIEPMLSRTNEPSDTQFHREKVGVQGDPEKQKMPHSTKIGRHSRECLGAQRTQVQNVAAVERCPLSGATSSALPPTIGAAAVKTPGRTDLPRLDAPRPRTGSRWTARWLDADLRPPLRRGPRCRTTLATAGAPRRTRPEGPSRTRRERRPPATDREPK